MKINIGPNTLNKILGISLLIFSVSFIAACSGGKPDKGKTMPVPVLVASVSKETVPVQINAIGNIEAYSTVSIKARVNGELTAVHFQEGKDVNKGDLLFTIDPRPYKAALDSAKANLLKDTALYKKAEEDEKRYSELYKEQLVSRSQYEQIFANAEALKATVEADKAAVENAELQLSYCTIHAPISGKTGSLLFNKGNQIKANDDKAMVVINQLQPTYVNFSVPEQNFPEIKKYMSKGSLKIEAVVAKDYQDTEKGTLSFIDNAVDASTGTIRIKGTFANKSKRLWPGQFVNVVMTLTTQPDAIVVPLQAVQTGQSGQYVFVVKNDMTVEMRPVVANRSFNDKAVIEKGLQPNEKVVTDGQMKLIPGVKIEIKDGKNSKEIKEKQGSKQ
ncbi:MAG: efflux RND transporter periplasmic adaptor subunit [Nitrospiraceae bacterium]|nr:efflux RND transporter periplasmic adaptor subunit [Nitrospiraceae bacterium]